jgi:hypothetical protein
MITVSTRAWQRLEKPGAGAGNPARGPRPEARSPKPGARSPVPEARCPKPGAVPCCYIGKAGAGAGGVVPCSSLHQAFIILVLIVPNPNHDFYYNNGYSLHLVPKWYFGRMSSYGIQFLTGSSINFHQCLNVFNLLFDARRFKLYSWKL